jgi:hypothetical protein
LVTKLGSSFTSFLFLLFKRENLDHWWSLFPGHNFRFESWKYTFPQPSLGGEEWLILVDSGKRDSRLDVCNTFEIMEVNRDNVGILKS